MITPQFVFMVIGIVSFAAAAVLLVVSIIYFTRNDIRGVMDDLSGKTRYGKPTAHASAGRKRPRKNRPASPAQYAAPSQEAQGSFVPETPGAAVQPLEDDLDTVLDTKLRKVMQGYGGVSSDIKDVNDGIPTLVTSVGEYHQKNQSEMKLEDADNPTLVDSAVDDAPTQVDNEPAARGTRFVVTKSILAIHSQEIIAEG